MADEWISAAEAYRLVSEVTGSVGARLAICARAYDGLINARALRLVFRGHSRDNVDVPRSLWWARGHEALTQNWSTGDFETWVHASERLNRTSYQMKAYGVTFERSGVEALIGPAQAAHAPQSDSSTNPGGRPPATWWDDLWIEICRQLWAGDLIPQRQADIETAMMNWLARQGHSPSDSTIRQRARKLWTALSAKGEN